MIFSLMPPHSIPVQTCKSPVVDSLKNLLGCLVITQVYYLSKRLKWYKNSILFYEYW
jgi:hypothetical protein